ncbi:MAG: hypothetical protein H0X39_07830 [Actinobacteria bacterium]|nr:hypothetical protein [Actinomycetota bacterium]
MQSVNIFNVGKPEGRLDVAQQLRSSGSMMFIYTWSLVDVRARTTTSSKTSGSS